MSRNDPLGDLLINVRASADQFTADMKKVQTSATNTTDAIIAGWGKSGAAADKAISSIERKAANKAIANHFRSTTDDIVRNWGKVPKVIDDTEKAFKNAGATLNSIEQMLGVNLPQAASKFLTTSKSIGPVLEAAFSTIAVVELIEVLGQLPAIFDKIKSALTGWDDKAKEAYARFIDDNRKAVEEAEKLRLKQIEIAQGAVAAAAAGVTGQTQATIELLKERLTLTAKIEQLGRRGIGQQTMMDLMFGDEEDLAKAKKRLAEIDALLGPAGRALQGAMVQGTEEVAAAADKMWKDQEEASKKAAQATKEETKARKDLADFWLGALQEFRNRTAQGGAEAEAGLRANEAIQKNIIAADKEHAKFMHDAGDELIKRNEYWNKALQDFRNQVPVAVAEGERHADDLAKKIIALSENARKEAERQAEQLFNSVKSTATRAFLDIFDSGESIFTNLANVIKGIFRTLAAELLSTMTAQLLTPLVGKLTGVMGLQAGGKLAGGLTGAAGLSAAISGLFGGGAAATSAVAALPGTLVPGTFAATIPAPAMGGAGMAGLMGALASNPLTWAAAGGLLAGTIWMKSQAHHEASTFVKTLQDPFGAELDRIMASSREAADKLEEIEDVWAEFSEAAVAFAQGGKDEALVVQQAFDTLNPLMESLRKDLTAQAEGIRDVTPTASGPVTVNLQMDGRTFARLVIPNLYALTRNEGMILVGAK